MGRRIWVVAKGDSERGIPTHTYDCRVLSFHRFLPAGPVASGEPNSHGGVRKKHLIQIWTNPGGKRTLTVGSIRLKRPPRAKERSETDETEEE